MATLLTPGIIRSEAKERLNPETQQFVVGLHQ